MRDARNPFNRSEMQPIYRQAKGAQVQTIRAESTITMEGKHTKRGSEVICKKKERLLQNKTGYKTELKYINIFYETQHTFSLVI